MKKDLYSKIALKNLKKVTIDYSIIHCIEALYLYIDTVSVHYSFRIDVYKN